MICLTGRTSSEVVALLEEWLAADDDERLVVETSGSTGAPKRVVLARDAVMAGAAATAERLGGAGPWLLALPPGYVAGAMVVIRSLLAGHRPSVVGADGSVAAALGSARGPVPRFCSLVPTQLHRLLGAPGEIEALRSLDTVLLGGGPIDPALRDRAAAAGVHVVATYGSAETAGGCVYDGLPLPAVEVSVIHPSDRIRLRGPMLFEGYDGDPALTAAVLVDGWFHTADRGRITEDGRLEVLGRVDDVILSGGIKVPAPAVAARLRDHPDLVDAEVLGVDDVEWGQRVVAFVVGVEGRQVPSIDALRDWVAAAHPRGWAPKQFVAVDAMPLLATGKPDRMALRGLT